MKRHHLGTKPKTVPPPRDSKYIDTSADIPCQAIYMNFSSLFVSITNCYYYISIAFGLRESLIPFLSLSPISIDSYPRTSQT